MVLDDQAPAGPGPLPRPELVRAAYVGNAGGAGGRASPDAVAAVEEGSGSPTTSSGGAGSSSSRPLPPPKPQRRPRSLGSSEGPSSSAASPATPPADADGPTPTQQLRTSPRRTMPLSPSKRPAGLQLLGNELALEAAEEQAGLLSPFTSIMGLAVALDEEGSSNGGGSSGGSTPGEEEGPFPPLPAVSVPPSASESGPPLQGKEGEEEEEDSTLSLLDGVAQSLLASEQQLPSPTTAAAAGHSPRLSLGEDGFVTSPPTLPADHTQEGSDAPPPSPATPTLAATTTAVGRPPAGKPKRHNHLRRISLPSLSAAVGGFSSSGSSTPRSGSVSGGLSLEALRAKLSGRSAAASTSTTAGPTAEKASDESLLLIQSAQRLGLDVSGLRKALLVRVLGVEPIPTAAGASNGSGNGKTSKRHRSASLGMMPAAWLKRGRGSPTVSPATPASVDARAEEEGGASYVVVLWVLDVESGHEWRVRKTPRDLLALHAVVSALGAGGGSGGTEWAPREEDFPLLQGGNRKGDKGGGSGSGSAAPLSREKQDRLERYLRALAAAVAVPAAPGAFEAAKTLQDFVGATERVDVLADCEARGDEAAHAARLVQLQGLELLQAGETGYMQRLEGFVREASTCDVHKTELLRAYVGLLSDVAREMVNVHGPRLKAPLQGGLLLGTGAAGEELDRFCVSALWRLLEAETFLPLRLRLYERVMLETDLAQEKALAAKCTLFKSFFGIRVAHISLSSWETAVAHLRRLSGDVTTLPSDKLDVLVAAVREAHALFRREHPSAEGTNTLGADDLLPIFIYILCQCGIARLLSLKTMLAALGDPARMLAEAGYCLATLEGAIEYILSLDEDAGEI